MAPAVPSSSWVDPELRRLAMEALQVAGSRWPVLPPLGWSGSRGRCELCAAVIAPDDLEFELEFWPPTVAEVRYVLLHRRCFAAWDLERPEPVTTPDGNGTAVGPGRAEWIVIVMTMPERGPARGCDDVRTRRPQP